MLRPGSETRRSAILDAVVRVIIDVGYTDMTVADVAQRAGVSTALVHYHFASKAALISAALRVASDEDKQLREAIAVGGRTCGRAARPDPLRIAAGRRLGRRLVAAVDRDVGRDPSQQRDP